VSRVQPTTSEVGPPEVTPWHEIHVQDVLARLDTSPDGLDGQEVEARRKRWGPNALPPPPRPHPILRFLKHFHNALIYFLLAAALAAALLNHPVDAAVIMAVVLVNAVVGYVQEGKAEEALEAIRDLVAPRTTVTREGARHAIDARNVVPGDVISLEPGDKVPADLRIMRVRSLLVNEAILTGESLPAGKSDTAAVGAASLGDRSSMLYSGTIIATGQATGVAVATGPSTEIGRIATLIGNVQTLTTPLIEQIDRFGRLFTWFAVAMAAAVFAFAYLARGYNWVDALMVVVALAVGAVPEGLPAVITITMAIGVRRMASRQAVVRRLPAVETLGSTSVICSDKTGTLTRNEMTACRIVTAGSTVMVEGGGYAPRGRLLAEDGPPGPDAARDLLLRAALLCNDADLIESPAGWTVVGDPMEGALVTLAMKSGLHVERERSIWRRLDEIPFDTVHRFMATLHHSDGAEARVFFKGAPEKLLAMSSTLSGGDPVDAAQWHAAISSAAGNGERVLGFATKLAEPGTSRLSFETVQKDITFLGLVGFMDPPRPEAIAAVAECRSAGILVKMITGDHADTAVAIARQIVIDESPLALTGADIEAMSDDELAGAARRTAVFARTSPEHKLRIVRALQSQGHVVAMTGDGVNDAPALKQADIGIAMGRKGTEAAKEAAEMVLVDDNFASIAAAVREGRTVYDNIRKVIAWTLPTNGGETLCVVIAIALWINMVLAVTLGLALAFEPPEPSVMKRPPRPRDEALLSGFLLWRVVFVSVLFAIGVFGVFEYALQRGLGEAAARTMVVNTLVVMEIFYLFNVRYLHMSSLSIRGAAGTPVVLIAIALVVAAQFTFTYAPFMHALFDSVPLGLLDGGVIIAVGVVVMIVLEAEKALMRRYGALRSDAPHPI